MAIERNGGSKLGGSEAHENIIAVTQLRDKGVLDLGDTTGDG